MRFGAVSRGRWRWRSVARSRRPRRPARPPASYANSLRTRPCFEGRAAVHNLPIDPAAADRGMVCTLHMHQMPRSPLRAPIGRFCTSRSRSRARRPRPAESIAGPRAGSRSRSHSPRPRPAESVARRGRVAGARGVPPVARACISRHARRSARSGSAPRQPLAFPPWPGWWNWSDTVALRAIAPVA